MSEVFTRPLTDVDGDGYWLVNALTYRNGIVPPENERKLVYSDPFVALVDGEVAGAFDILPMTCTRGRAVLTSGGIGGVAVAPHHRKKRVGSNMLTYAVRHMRETGIVMSSLYAFSEAYYRQFGYETAGRRIRIECPVNRLPKGKETLALRRLSPDDWSLLENCHKAFAQARSGVSLRTELQWKRVLNEHRPLTIYAAGDPVEGYVALAHSVNFWTTDPISEVVWSTTAGYYSALSILRSIGMNKNGFSWYEPSDGPFLLNHLDHGVDVKFDRLPMFRVNDVPLALRSLKPENEASGEFRIGIVDDCIPENKGPWRVRFSRDGVQVEKTDEADFTMPVGVFAPAFLGEPSLADLAHANLVQVTNPSALKVACELLTPCPTYLPEFF